MEAATLIIFVLTYAGIALGAVPGLAIDRTGIALLGAIAMVAAGAVPEREAILAIDMPTILLLYSLMVISSQFRLGGFYTHVAEGLTRHLDRPRYFLFTMMSVSAVLSAVLANDIVCLAFTPVLAVALVRGGLNPVPFLLGLAISSNIGSAATIIGNPQNMLIGQMGHLHFGHFFLWCLVPSLASHLASYVIILRLYAGRFLASKGAPPPLADEEWSAYDPHQSAKGLAITGLLVVLFFTSIPREVSAVCAAGFLLCSRKMTTRSILGLVDWHLITLFCSLFIVIKGIETTGLPGRLVDHFAEWGIDLHNLYVLGGVSVVLSNIVSNVPATMLLVKFLDAAHAVPWYVLALSSTYAGNLLVIGSIANLITLEQARRHGVVISFREHARAGVPVTLASLGILALWMLLMRA